MSISYWRNHIVKLIKSICAGYRQLCVYVERKKTSDKKPGYLLKLFILAVVFDFFVGCYMAYQSNYNKVHFLNTIEIPPNLSGNGLTSGWISDQVIEKLATIKTSPNIATSKTSYAAKPFSFSSALDLTVNFAYKAFSTSANNIHIDIPKWSCEALFKCTTLIKIKVLDFSEKRRVSVSLKARTSSVTDHIDIEGELDSQIYEAIYKYIEPCKWFTNKVNSSKPTKQEWLNCSETDQENEYLAAISKGLYLSFDESKTSAALSLGLMALTRKPADDKSSKLALYSANNLIAEGLIPKSKYVEIYNLTKGNLDKNSKELKTARLLNEVLLKNQITSKEVRESLRENIEFELLKNNAAVVLLKYFAEKGSGNSNNHLVRDILLSDSTDNTLRLVFANYFATVGGMAEDSKYAFRKLSEDKNELFSAIAAFAHDGKFNSFANGKLSESDSLLVQTSSTNPISGLLAGIISIDTDESICEQLKESSLIKSSVSLLSARTTSAKTALDKIILGILYKKGLGTNLNIEKGNYLIRDSREHLTQLGHQEIMLYHALYGFFERNSSDSLNSTIENLRSIINKGAVYKNMSRAFSKDGFISNIDKLEKNFFELAAEIHSVLLKDDSCSDGEEFKFEYKPPNSEASTYIPTSFDFALELAIARLYGPQSFIFSNSKEFKSVKRDYSKAFSLFVFLSKQDSKYFRESAEAKFFISKMYRSGLFVPKSCLAAEHWFSLSLAEGSELANKTTVGACVD